MIIVLLESGGVRKVSEKSTGESWMSWGLPKIVSSGGYIPSGGGTPRGDSYLWTEIWLVGVWSTGKNRDWMESR